MSLVDLKIYPIPKPIDIVCSPCWLGGLLKSKTILSSCGEGVTGDDVNTRLRQKIAEDLREFKVPRERSYIRHFEIQEVKSGVGGLYPVDVEMNDNNGHEMEDENDGETEDGEDNSSEDSTNSDEV